MITDNSLLDDTALCSDNDAVICKQYVTNVTIRDHLSSCVAATLCELTVTITTKNRSHVHHLLENGKMFFFQTKLWVMLVDNASCTIFESMDTDLWATLRLNIIFSFMCHIHIIFNVFIFVFSCHSLIF